MPQLIFVLSILGFVATLYLMITGRMSSTSTINFLFIVSALTSGAYILFDRFWNLKQGKNQNLSDNQVSYRYSPQLRRTLDISFWIGYSILLLVVFFDDVHQPLYIFVLSILVCILIFKLFVSNTKIHYFTSLLNAFMLLSLSSFSLFKTYYWIGRDSWKHATWNANLAESGFLSEDLGKEFVTPLHHIFVAMYELISGVGVRDATIIAISLSLLVLFSLAVFIISRKIIGDKYAILAVIISGYVGMFPYWVGQAVTTSYAYALFATLLILLYGVLFNCRDKTAKTYSLLFLLIVFTLALSHLFSSFMVFLFLCGVIITYILLRTMGVICCSIKKIYLLLSGISILAVYTLLTQFSLMESIFTVAFSKLFEVLGQYLPMAAVSAGTMYTLSPADVLSSLVATIDTASIVQLIDSSVTIVNPTLVGNIQTMGVEFSLILIPYVLAVCFSSRYCLTSVPTKYQVQYLFVLVPFLMIFILFGVTSVAYPPMSGRPQAFLLLSIGILVSCLIRHFTMGNQESSISLKKHIVVALIVVCLVVSGSIVVSNSGGLSTESDLSLVSTGYSYPEIDGLFTISHLVPQNSRLLVDYEMTDAQLLRYVSAVTQCGYVIPYENMLTYYPTKKYNDCYLLFRESLVHEATYSTTQTGNSELTIIWDKYNIDSSYPKLLGAINPVLYDNGELLLFEV